jgi:divalent metal cation (Fe/Co/Zn/Cd) transporter
MAESFPILDGGQSCSSSHETARKSVLWLQGITLAWMAVEAGISLYAAAAACSIALLAFGSDSLVELLSAAVVVLSVNRRSLISPDRAARWAGILLFALAGVVAIAALRALMTGVTSEASPAGIGVTIAALVVMPILAWFKRRLGRKTNNRALVADSVQSATCAYLAAVTLVGLALNAAFHIRWIDPVAALVVLPILVVEGRRALRGDPCTCC